MKPTLTLTTMMVLGFAANLLAQLSQSQNPNDNPPGKVVKAQFSPDGQLIGTTSKDGTARVWDAQTGKPVPGPLPHLGTWQLVSLKYGDATKWSDAPSDQRRIKLITESHFTWVAYELASGKVQSMAGGTYTFSDGAYTESIEYAGEGMTDYFGKKQSFTIRVEGDKLHQSGKLSDGTKVEEVWQRVK
jgi:hypothetical protein